VSAEFDVVNFGCGPTAGFLIDDFDVRLLAFKRPTSHQSDSNFFVFLPGRRADDLPVPRDLTQVKPDDRRADFEVDIGPLNGEFGGKLVCPRAIPTANE